VIDGIAEVEAESLEEAEKIVNERLSDFVGSNPDLEKNMGAKAIQGKGYLPGSEEEA
jgi:ribonucleotide monophosphatase NagD (HAD superfamily)